MRPRCLSALVVASAVTLGCANTSAAADEPLVPDTALKHCINAELKNDLDHELTRADLAKPERIHCIFNGVKSLKGLEHATSLVQLWVDGSELGDLSPLAFHPTLEQIHVGSLVLDDIRPLGTISTLKELLISGPFNSQKPHEAKGRLKINDLTPIASLKNLEEFGISGVQVSDLSPLAQLTKLRYLSVEGAPVSDISPLSSISSLEWLFLTGTDLSDVSQLQSLPHLVRFNARSCRIADMSPLKQYGHAPYWFQDQVIELDADASGVVAYPVRDIRGDIVVPEELENLTYKDGTLTLIDPTRPGAATFSSNKRTEEHLALFSGVVTVRPFAEAAEPGEPSVVPPTPTTTPSSPMPTLSTPTTTQPPLSVPSTTTPAPAPASKTEPETTTATMLARTGLAALGAFALAAVLGVGGACLTIARKRLH